METPPPADLDTGALHRVVGDGWPITVDEVVYFPKGAGSYHWSGLAHGKPTCFLTIDDLDSKPWIDRRRDHAYFGLGTAFRAVWALAEERGASFAVGPLEDRTGEVIRRLSERYSLAIFPYVAGEPGAWGVPLVPVVRDELIGHLARLHETPHVELGLAQLPYAIPERPELERALSDLGGPFEASAGPLAGPARRCLRAHAGRLTAELAEMDDLAARLRRSEERGVVTHGEPHPGNVILATDGVRLIDWDTIALARPERDLWMLEDGSSECLEAYEELTGRSVNLDAIRYFRLLWTLSDVSSLLETFAAPHEETAVTELQFAALERLLAGGTSEPYGHRR